MAAARLQRWAIRLSAYVYDIEFRSTQEQSNAGCLSHLPMNCVSTVGHTSEPAQINISQIERVAQATRTNTNLSVV